jgi:tetratricopeptide (TPR) repeat protein
LFHELAYETLVSTNRRQLHGRLADHLIASGAADPSVVAFHLARAGRTGDAIVYHQIAAFGAQERTGAHAVALQQLDESFQLLEHLPPEDRPTLELASRVLRGLSRVFTQSYASPAAAEDYQRALQLCEEMEYSPLIVPLTVAVWSYYTVGGDVVTAGRVIDGLLRLGESEEGTYFRPEIETCAAVQRFYEGRFADAAAHFAAADAGFSSRGHPTVSPVWRLPNDPVVAAWSISAGCSWLMGDDRAGDDAVVRAVERARTLPFPVGPFSECFALVGAIWLAELKRDNAASLAASASLIEIASMHAYPFWQGVGMLRAAIASGRIGDAAGAADQVASAIDLWHALGVKAYGPCNLANLAELRLAAGDLAKAAAAADESVTQAETTGERFFLAEALRIRGEIAAASGRVDEAISSLMAAVALSRQQHAPRFQLRAAVALATKVPVAQQDPSWLEDVAEAVRGLPDASGLEMDAARALLRERAHHQLSTS